MSDLQTDVVVLGSGPGGYTAAFRAADLGLKVMLVERYPNIGGVCLNVGCIPSKALLHAAKVIQEAHTMGSHGISFGEPKIDLDKLRTWKDGIVSRLTGGLKMLSKQRKVDIITGNGQFLSSDRLEVTSSSGEKQVIHFKHAIIAAGSQPVQLPFLPEDERIIDSTGALELSSVPDNLLVIGGGIIGLEMATVYNALGSKITVVELFDSLMPGVDKDIVKPYLKKVKKQYENIYLETKVIQVEAKKDGLYVTFEGKNAPKEPMKFSAILSAVGRTPNGKLIGADRAGVKVTERGFIEVDKQQRTNVSNIYAIGDIVGNPMLAHKAIPEGKIAAEVIAGKKHYFEPQCIPSVAYTDPEVAWVGVTEQQVKEQSLPVEAATFPWAASGRALCEGSGDGLTKVLFNKDTNKIVGAAIIGTNAGELIAEAALAIEMGCDAEDIALTIHPHPTLSESIAMATEIFEGSITDLYIPKKN